MCVQIQRPAKPLNNRHGATVYIGKAALAGAGAQMPMHLPQQHAHHGLAQVVAPGQQIPEAVRQRQDPLHPNAHSPRVGGPGLSNRDIRDDVVHQVRGALGHAPAAAPRTEPSALARERDQALGLAPDAPESCEPASEEAARQERPKLLLDKARHALAVAEVRCLGEERLQVLAYHTM